MPTWIDFAPKPRPLEGDDEYTVFLSYRSLNRLWVIRLYDVLTSVGHKVFLDETVLKPGERLRSTIASALRGSQAGVLVWSKDARTSQWVEDEYNTMLDLRDKKPGFCFVPIRITKDDMPGFVDLNKFIDFTDYPDGPNGEGLMGLLFGIVDRPRTPEALTFATERDQEAKDIESTIKVLKNADKLRTLAETGGPCWDDMATLAGLAIESLTKIEAYDDAIAVAELYEPRFPKALRIKQMKALAHARRAEQRHDPDDLDEAHLILAKLYEDRHRDPETVGIFARTYMDKFETSKKRLYLERSRELYRDAFEADPNDYYVGINAAAKSVFLKNKRDLELADHLADRVEAIVGTEPVADDYWMSATVAEVQLIRQNYAKAAELYRCASRTAPDDTGSRATTRTQAERLMHAMKTPQAERDAVLAAFAD